MLDVDIEKTLARLFYLGIPAVSMFVLTGNVTDPVNATKFLLLGGVGVSVLLLVAARGLRGIWMTQRLALILGFLFMTAALISMIFSSSPFTQNLYGVYGRNTGFLTYLFLVGIFLGASLIQDQKSFRRIYIGLFVTGTVNVLYCGWVVFFGDFIGWSNPYGNILGLFGNPNFIGAFLGIWISSTIAYFIFNRLGVWKKICLGGLILLALYEVYMSHAVQGVVVTSAGLITVIFFYIRSKTSGNLPVALYSISMLSVGIVALLGTLQKGPLAQIIYKTSVTLRGEYWHAGLRMGLDHPITGVGMDAYGDWYRRTRSESAATILPGPNTVTNSAHNVPIDIFSYGGFPLVLCYLGIIGLGAFAIIHNIRRTRNYDPIFVALSVSWIGYQLQSLISINQIGLAVWGWLLTGLLVAYEYQASRKRDSGQNKAPKRDQSSPRQTQKTVTNSLLAGIGVVFGLILAAPPISGDMNWFQATKSANLQMVEEALVPTYMHPQDSSRLVNVVGILENSKLYDLAVTYAVKATEFNHDNFDAWLALYSVKNATPDQKMRAIQNMKRLDPRNPEVAKY